MTSRLCCALLLACCVISAVWGSDAERKALLAIAELDARGALAQVAADDLRRLGVSADATVRRMADFYAAKGQLPAQRESVLKRWQALLAGEQPGTELWALITLGLGDSRRQQEPPDADAALLAYQDILTRRPQGLIALRAAIASGEVFAAKGDEAQAAKAWQWALALLERDRYLDAAKAGISADALKQRLADLGAKQAKAKPAEDLVLFRRAEDFRLKGDWLAAVKVYDELMKRFPASSTIPPATWGFGDCLMTAGRLENALQYWSDFVATDPTGPWRAQAMISLGDALLERRFDLAAAKGYIDKVAAYYPSCRDGQVAGWADMGYAIHQRQGLLAYIDNQPAEAIAWFAKASQCNPPRSYRTAHGNLPSGLDQLIDRLRRGDSLTPASVREGRSEAALILLLADIHQAADDLPKAEPLYQRVIENDQSWIEQVANSTSDGAIGSRLLPPMLPRQPVAKLNPTPAQRAWATYQSARIAHTHFAFEQAIAAYLKVADGYKECAWADAALVRAGILYFSNLRKPGEALGCFTRVVNAYPTGDEAQRAGMYVGMIYAWGGNWPKAKAAYLDYLKKFPQSPYAKAISTDLLPEVEAKLAAKQGR